MDDADVDVSVPPLDGEARAAAVDRAERLTKPPGSLGRMEEAAVRVAAMTGEPRPTLADATAVTAAGDHGVAAEGVSAYPASVTRGMVATLVAGGAAVNAFAGAAGVDHLVVDAGVRGPTPEGALDRTVREGTDNVAEGPAMTRAEAAAAVAAGRGLVRERSDADAFALGEMGIANTTPSAALTAVLADADPDAVTGRGTGISAAKRRKKVRVVERALSANDPDPADPLGCLARVGGFEHGLLVGVSLEAAARRMPVVLDGYVTGAAALVAVGIAPRAGDYLLPSHAAAEAGHAVQLDALGLDPLFDYGMRLGEGTGAVLALSHYRAACAALSGMATFAEAGLE